VGGVSEFLPTPPNRLVVPDVTAWAIALDEWLRLVEIEQLRAEGNAQEANKYDWPSVVGKYLHVYEEVVHLNGIPPNEGIIV